MISPSFIAGPYPPPPQSYRRYRAPAREIARTLEATPLEMWGIPSNSTPAMDIRTSGSDPERRPMTKGSNFGPWRLRRPVLSGGMGCLVDNVERPCLIVDRFYVARFAPGRRWHGVDHTVRI